MCFHTFDRDEYIDQQCTSSSCSVEQGFWKPRGYVGKGLEGRGQGTEQLTPHKPLPMSTGKGIPLLLQVGKFAPVF